MQKKERRLNVRLNLKSQKERKKMWFFICFAIVHVYLVFYHDYIERNGTTSSMIGGWKFQEEGKEEREKELDK